MIYLRTPLPTYLVACTRITYATHSTTATRHRFVVVRYRRRRRRSCVRRPSSHAAVGIDGTARRATVGARCHGNGWGEAGFSGGGSDAAAHTHAHRNTWFTWPYHLAPRRPDPVDFPSRLSARVPIPVMLFIFFFFSHYYYYSYSHRCGHRRRRRRFYNAT